MAEGPYEIRPGHTGADYFPNFLEDFVDPKKVRRATIVIESREDLTDAGRFTG